MLADYLTRLASTLRDTDQRTTEAEQRTALADAVLRYSGDRPRRIVEDVEMASGNVVALAADWISGFSDVIAIEAPIGRVPPVLLAANRIYLLDTPDGLQITLADVRSAGEIVRVSYTSMHALDEDTDSIPVADRPAVVLWAASILADQVAASYSDQTAPTIQADRVDQGSPAMLWAKRAAGWRARYYELLGIPAASVSSAPSAAGTTVALQREDSRGRERLTHTRNRV